MVFIQERPLVTELFQKPMDKNTLLHYNSAHPRAMIQSLPYSQFLRARRLITENEKWLQTAAKMTNDFKDRDYPPSLIQKQFDCVNNMDINNTRQPSRKTQGRPHFPFVSMFSELSPKVGAILRKHWPILRKSLSHFKISTTTYVSI